MGSKMGFYRHINSKRKARENVGSVLNGVGDLVTMNVEKAAVLNA